MFAPLSPTAAILDLGKDAQWDAEAIQIEMARRARALHQAGVVAGDVVVIAHGDSAHFFFDLFATWRVGAAAALSRSELDRGGTCARGRLLQR